MKKPTNKVISEKKRTAKKAIPCDACKWLKLILSDDFYKRLTPEEQKAVAQAQKNDWCIIKGQQYFEHLILLNGQRYTSRFLDKINNIVAKYDVINKVRKKPVPNKMKIVHKN